MPFLLEHDDQFTDPATTHPETQDLHVNNVLGRFLLQNDLLNIDCVWQLGKNF